MCLDLDGDDPAAMSVRAALSHRPTDVEAVFLDPAEGGSLDQAALDWLARQGIGIEAIASPIAIRTARVCIDQMRCYTPNPIGDLALVIPVLDAEGVIDFCAWVPRTGETATRWGVGAILGGELVGLDTGDGVTVPPLRVFWSPLDWLRAGRRGLVVLDWRRAAIVLSGINVVAEDAVHAAELRKLLHLPGPVVHVASGTVRSPASSESARVLAGADS